MSALPARLARPFRILALALLVAALAGCYVPVRFDAEIEIDRAGYYSMIFDGYLARAQVYDGIKKRKLTGDERQRRIDQVVADLKRDTATKEATHYKDGIFKVNWHKKGDLLKAKFVSFLRRNENLLSIRYVRPKGQIILAGTPISDSQAEQLEAIGLTVNGEVRLITDAKVVAHNAASERDWPDAGPRFKMYTWPIPNPHAPTPAMTIQIHSPIGG